MLEGDILIWGEFPPNTHTGVSVSNQNVLNTLNAENISPVIIEEYSWNKNNIRKVFHYINLYCKLFMIIYRKRIKIFYFTLPLSVLGELKFLVILPVVKLLSPKTVLKAHIHRGDFKVFIHKNRLNKFIIRYCFRFIDEIIVLSEYFLQDVLNFYNRIEVSVLHNTSIFESSYEKLYRDYNRTFICISNYIRSKGLQELIECFRSEMLKDHKLAIYGHPYDKSFYKILKLSATENVSLNSHLKRVDFPRVLGQSDCLIMPSWNEGQPITIIEAMSLGIPVIATNVGDMPDMLGEDYQFLVQPQNTELLLNTILAFDSFENKNKIAKYLYQRYLDKYSNESYKKRLLEIFK